MHPLEQNVMSLIQQENLINEGDSVLVALSGGADSVALLRILKTYSTEYGYSLYAAHVHHGLRGEYADRDEAFARDLCEELSIPLYIAHVDVHAEVSRTKESVEEAGRRLRYAFFEEKIADLPNGKIATAHSASDQAETVLLRLMRGCGIKGVSGIPVKRDRIIRPLLTCYSDEIRDYCSQNAFAYMIDETNEQLCFTRNRVRHQILANMRDVNPQIEQSLVRFSTMASMDNHFLESCADELLKRARLSEHTYCVQTLLNADKAIRYRAIARMTEDAEFFHIQALCELMECGGTVNFPHDLAAVSDGRTLSWTRYKETISAKKTQEVVCVTLNEPFVMADVRYFATCVSYRDYIEKLREDSSFSKWCVAVRDFTKLRVRSRESGDRIAPLGRGCTKAVKKLLNEDRVPISQRDRIPVVLDGDRVAALLGLCVDEASAVTESAPYIVWFRKMDAS